MLIDATPFAAGSELAADICIIGAGAAGLILAHELAQSGFDILVLESGGPDQSPQTAALMTGRAVTRPPSSWPARGASSADRSGTGAQTVR